MAPKMPQNPFFAAILANNPPHKASEISYGQIRVASPLQEQDIRFGDHQCRGVKRRVLEDPVKNGACLTNVRPRRGL